ncbi:MAG: hypothetical protein ACLPJH_08270 [Myxococcaceae bacterium]
MRQRRKPQDVEQLDQLWALLLRANALREGDAARLAAAHPAPPRKPGPHAAPVPAHALDVSVEKQRLHCTLRGFFDVAQAESMLAELRVALAQLRPGFDVVADVSRLGGVSSSALPFFRRAATAFVEAGMHRMVRVVGSSPGAATSVARASEGLYEARVVASAKEAALLLDGGLGAAEAHFPALRSPVGKADRHAGSPHTPRRNTRRSR